MPPRKKKRHLTLAAGTGYFRLHGSAAGLAVTRLPPPPGPTVTITPSLVAGRVGDHLTLTVRLT